MHSQSQGLAPFSALLACYALHQLRLWSEAPAHDAAMHDSGPSHANGEIGMPDMLHD